MKAKKYTAAEWRKAVKWAKSYLGLEDWSIDLHYGQRPDWVRSEDASGLGTTHYWREEKRAEIWIHQAECARHKIPPARALCHEILHIAMADADADTLSDPIEFLIRRLEIGMHLAYRKGVK